MLVNLAYPGYLGNVSTLPAGLGYVAQSLEESHIDCDVLDLGLWPDKQEKKRLQRKIEACGPDLLGISMMTLGYKGHYELISSVKQYAPQLTVVVGGPHISTFREEALARCPAIDFGIVLEGDQSFVELCQGKELSAIKGLVYRKEGGIVYTGDREFITDLDSLAFPRYRKFELKQYSPEIPIVTSRGCPYSCIYCPVQKAIGRKFRCRSAASVVEEMGYWYGQGFRDFSIWDDNFTLAESRVYEICDMIQGRGWKDINLKVPNGVRADRVTRPMLERMRQVGFSMLSFGVESGSDKVLKNLKKGETVATLEKAIADACDLGYEVFLYFLIGSPGETWQDFEQSLALAQKYPVAEARFYTLVLFPGTELMEWAKANDYLLNPPERFLNDIPHFQPQPCFATPEMSAAQRVRAFKLGWQVTRKQRRAFWDRRLARLGLLGRIVAIVAASDSYHRAFKAPWLRKALVEPAKRLLAIK